MALDRAPTHPLAAGPPPGLARGGLPPEHGCALVGREDEAARLVALLTDGGRLAMVVGPPGVGKSRLARHALRLAGRPVAWIPLDDVTTAEGLARAVLDGLGVLDDRPADRRALSAVLTGQGPLVLALDAADGVLEWSWAEMLGWRATHPGLSLLVTARHAPPDASGGLPSSRMLSLDPLPLRGAPSPAGRMFAACARLVAPTHPPTPAEAEDLATLLDGLPRAIELAAGRLAVMSAAGLAARIRRSGRTRVVGRALGDLLDDIADGLAPDERRAIALLSTFAGGFEPDAALDLAERVLGSGLDLLDVLCRLRRRGLVVPVGGSDGPRLAVLGCVAEHLAGRLDPAVAARDRRGHALGFAARAAMHHAALHGADSAAERRWFRIEAPNLARALDVALADGADPEMAAAAWALIASFDAQAPGWTGGDFDPAAVAGLAPIPTAVHGWLSIGQALGRLGRLEAASAAFVRAEALAGEDRALRGRALVGQGTVLARGGAPREAIATYDAARALLDGPGEGRARGWALAGRGLAWCELGEHRSAAVDLRASIALLDAAGDAYGAAVQRGNLGLVCARLGDLDAARRAMARAVAATERSGAARITLYLRSNLAGLAHEAGDLVGALRLHDAIDEDIERLGEPRLLTAQRLGRGILRRLTGDAAGARADCASALTAAREAGDARFEVEALGALAAFDAEDGDVVEAQVRLTAAEARSAEVELGWWPAVRAVVEARIALGGWRERLAADDADGAATLVREARARWAALAAEARADSAPAPVPIRRALMLLSTACDAAADRLAVALPAPADAGALVVEAGCLGLWLPDGVHLDLRRRRLGRRLLAALVAARIERPGEGLDVDALWAAGWPGERVRPASRQNRTYVAIADLRTRGLRDLLLSRGGGYLLDPAVPIRRRPD